MSGTFNSIDLFNWETTDREIITEAGYGYDRLCETKEGNPGSFDVEIRFPQGVRLFDPFNLNEDKRYRDNNGYTEWSHI